MIKKIVVPLILLLLGIVLYGATLRGVAGNPSVSSFKNNLDLPTKPFELSPERGRYLLTMSLGDYGRFDLRQDLADAAFPDVGVFDGRYYIFFAPGISMLALPLYLLGKMYGFAQVGAYATITAFAILNLFVLYLIGRRILKFSVETAVVSALVFGFASSAWSYATTLYQHHVTTFFIISSFYAVWRFAQKQRFSWIWGIYIWICYAFAILIDYPNVFLMAPVMIYFFINSFSVSFKDSAIRISTRLAFSLTAIGFVLISAWHGYYNYQNFGDWKKVSGSIVGVKYLREIELSRDDQLKKADELNSSAKKDPVGFFSEHNIPFSFYTLFFSRDRGLFFYYPIFILALFGIANALRRGLTRETGTLLGIAGASVLLYSSWGDPWGGWAFGPRYLTVASAVFALFVGYWVHTTHLRLVSRLFVWVTFLFSSAVALVGALTTNAVPPQVEGEYLKIKYNYFFNYYDFLIKGRSSSFVYNTYIHDVTLTNYYIVLYLIIAVSMTAILVSSYFRKRNATKH